MHNGNATQVINKLGFRGSLVTVLQKKTTFPQWDKKGQAMQKVKQDMQKD